MSSVKDLEAKNTSQDLYLPLRKRKIFQEPRSQPNLVEEETRKTTTATSGNDHSHCNLPVEDLEAKNGLQDPDVPSKKHIKPNLVEEETKKQEPRSIKPNPVGEETRKTTTGMSGGDRSHRSLQVEDLKAKNSLQDPDLPSKKRKTYQEPGSINSNLVEEETRRTTTGMTGGDGSHRSRPVEDLEAKNGLQVPDLPSKKRKTYQELGSINSNLVEEETRRTTTGTKGGDCSHRSRPVEDHEAKNSLQVPALPSKKQKTYQELRSINSNLVEEETGRTTTGTNGGNHSHCSRGPCKKLCTGVHPCNELMQTLLGLGINNTVRVLRKKLSETDVNPDQNRLQHSEKEVQQVLLDMMTEEEKQLAMQKGKGDGLRVSVLDRLGRVYHMKLKKLHSTKKYFRFRGSDYHNFVKDNDLKAGEILETWAARVQRQEGGQIREEGDGGIMDGELLLVMLNCEDNSYEKIDNKEAEMLTPAEKESLDALLLLQEKPVIFGSSFLH